MGQFTRVSQYLLDWEPLCRLQDPCARYLWISLYIGAPAKKWLPGLLRVTTSELAETARMGYVDVQNHLTHMVDVGLIERDGQYRIIRFLELPDRGEQPASSKVLRMFWNRFRDLPELPICYRYIDLFEWLVQPTRTDKLLQTWNETFQVRKEAYTMGVSEQTQSGANGHPVDNLRANVQLPLIQHGKDTVSDTLSHTVSDTVGSTEYGVRSTVSDRVGGPGEGKGTPAAPRQVLAEGCPFTVSDMLEAIAAKAGGRVAVDVVDHRIGPQLWDVVKVCGEVEITLEDVELVGEYLAAGYLDYRGDLDTRWLAKPGALAGAVSKARQWDQGGRGDVKVSSRKKGPAAMVERARRLRREEA